MAAILFADVEGYSHLMQLDEERAARQLGKFQELIREQVFEHQGEIVNFYGDGVLCIFSNPVQAVRCAISLQQEYRKEPEVPVRMGIHNGTVVVGDDKVYGHGVNLAARIEALGTSGSILLSEQVRDEIRNFPEFQIRKLDRVKVKNIDKPVVLYTLDHKDLAKPSPEKIAQASTGLKPRWRWIGPTLLLLILAIIYFFVQKSAEISSDPTSLYHLDESEIAIRVFENNTMQDDYEMIGKMAADWITHGIVENQIAPVISFQTLDTYEDVTLAGIGPKGILNRLSGEVKVIEGNYYVVDSTLIFQCSVMEHGTDRPLHAFPKIECPIDRPLEGIMQLQDDVLGYWVTREKGHLRSDAPAFSAYEYYLKAQDVWAGDYAAADSFLTKSIEIDPDFMHARILQAHLYYNTGDYKRLDELVGQLEREIDPLNLIQSNMVIYLRALLSGDNRQIFETYQREYATAPKDLFKNTAMMIIATNFVRRPEVAIDLFPEIDPALLDYSNCSYCVVRMEIMASALLDLGRDQEVIELLEPIVDKTKRRGPKIYLIKAYFRTEQLDRVEDLLSARGDEDHYLFFLAAHEAQLLNLRPQKELYARQAIKRYESEETRNMKMLGRCHFVLEKFEDAQRCFLAVLEDNPGDIFCMGKLAAIAFENGDEAEAAQHLEKMLEAKREYDFGYTYYFMAQANAQGGRIEEAFRLLKLAVKEGDILSNIDYENDPLLSDLHELSEWKEIVEYWSTE